MLGLATRDSVVATGIVLALNIFSNEIIAFCRFHWSQFTLFFNGNKKSSRPVRLYDKENIVRCPSVADSSLSTEEDSVVVTGIPIGTKVDLLPVEKKCILKRNSSLLVQAGSYRDLGVDNKYNSIEDGEEADHNSSLAFDNLEGLDLRESEIELDLNRRHPFDDSMTSRLDNYESLGSTGWDSTASILSMDSTRSFDSKAMMRVSRQVKGRLSKVRIGPQAHHHSSRTQSRRRGSIVGKRGETVAQDSFARRRSPQSACRERGGPVAQDSFARRRVPRSASRDLEVLRGLKEHAHSFGA